MLKAIQSSCVILCLLLSCSLMAAEPAGVIKTLTGKVTLLRGNAQLPAKVGTAVFAEDTLTTGADGMVGITLADGTRLTGGHNSTLRLNRYSYNPTTHVGEVDASLNKGAMAVISGKIAKTSPDNVKFHTLHSIVGVRGTEFVIESGESL